MTDIQARHAQAVRAGRLRLADRWGQPCLGYVFCFRPDSAGGTAFAAVQQEILSLEPSLLRQPEAALHSSIAWLLPVHREFDQPKDETWQHFGSDWLTTIAKITDTVAPIRLRFRRLVMTDGAIIAVADEPNPVSELRREVVAALDLPWPITYSSNSVVHVTLFRYRQPLANPAWLLARLERTQIAVDTALAELLVIRETVYPTLAYEIACRLPLGARQPL